MLMRAEYSLFTFSAKFQCGMNAAQEDKEPREVACHQFLENTTCQRMTIGGSAELATSGVNPRSHTMPVVMNLGLAQ